MKLDVHGSILLLNGIYEIGSEQAQKAQEIARAGGSNSHGTFSLTASLLLPQVGEAAMSS